MARAWRLSRGFFQREYGLNTRANLGQSASWATLTGYIGLVLGTGALLPEEERGFYVHCGRRDAGLLHKELTYWAFGVRGHVP